VYHISKSYRLEHRTQVSPQRDPDFLEGTRRSSVTQVLRPLPAHVSKWSFHRTDHIGEGYLLWSPRQLVAASSAPLRPYEARPLQVEQYILQKLLRYPLRLRDVRAPDRLVPLRVSIYAPVRISVLRAIPLGGQLHHGP
jgi:hypothetical protein